MLEKGIKMAEFGPGWGLVGIFGMVGVFLVGFQNQNWVENCHFDFQEFHLDFRKSSRNASKWPNLDPVGVRLVFLVWLGHS